MVLTHNYMEERLMPIKLQEAIQKLGYRDASYFKEGESYVFEIYPNSYIVDQVHLYNGYWFTNTKLNWKATTLKAVAHNRFFSYDRKFKWRSDYTKCS